MKSKLVTLAIVLAGLPAIAWGQAPCGCGSKHSIRPASYGTWSDYQPAGYSDGGCGCTSCTSRAPSCASSCSSSCCTPCCGRQLLCIIPNTVRKIGSVLDCILPCGPRACNSCSVGCSSGCPSCSSPAMDPFTDDLPAPPKPPVQESRRQPVRAPREYAAAPSASSKTASARPVSTRPATKSVLTRAPKMAEEEVSQAGLTVTPLRKPTSSVRRTSAVAPVVESGDNQSARRSSAIPVNPLR